MGDRVPSYVSGTAEQPLLFLTIGQALERAGFLLIDCQQQTAHLESLGARGISRELFLEYLNNNVFERTLVGKWGFDEENGVSLEK